MLHWILATLHCVLGVCYNDVSRNHRLVDKFDHRLFYISFISGLQQYIHNTVLSLSSMLKISLVFLKLLQ